MIVNALGGLADPNVRDAADPFSPRVLAEAHASGVTAINCTFGYVAGPAEPFEKSVADVAETDMLLRRYPRDLIKILERRATSAAPRPKRRSASSTASRTAR